MKRSSAGIGFAAGLALFFAVDFVDQLVPGSGEVLISFPQFGIGSRQGCVFGLRRHLTELRKPLRDRRFGRFWHRVFALSKTSVCIAIPEPLPFYTRPIGSPACVFSSLRDNSRRIASNTAPGKKGLLTKTR